jgi:hypothetical protein
MSRICFLLAGVCVLAVGLPVSRGQVQPLPPPAPDRSPERSVPSVYAHPPGARPAVSPADGITAVFHDGTVIRRVDLAGSVELQTKYGKLTIPVKDIFRIEFAFRLSTETAREVEEAVTNLGSKQFKQREAASKKLLALGAKAWPALLKAAGSKDMEVSRRVQTLVGKIQQTVPADQLQTRPDDIIRAGDCILTGRLVGDSLTAKTRNFGEMQFRFTELRSLHAPRDVEGTRRAAASYSRPVSLAPPGAIPPAPPFVPAPVLQPAPANVPAPAAPQIQTFQMGFSR